MKTLLIVAAAVLLLVLALQAAVRLAPTDPARWHTDPGLAGAEEARENLPGGVRVARTYAAPPAEILARLDAIARRTPRTEAIAGSVADGSITYRTRSAFWGFPDFTTVAADPADGGGTRLRLHARLRFGGSDMGVNGRRVDDWLARLD